MPKKREPLEYVPKFVFGVPENTVKNADILEDIGSFSYRNQDRLEESDQEHVSNKANVGEGPFAPPQLARATQWRIGTTQPPIRRGSTRSAMPLLEVEKDSRVAALATMAPELDAR